MSYRSQPLCAALGREITGIRLSADLSDSVIASLRSELSHHCVLVVRDQQMSPPEQIAFTRRFGDLVRRIKGDFLHPEFPDVLVLSNRTENGATVGATPDMAGFTWHSDLTYAQHPSMASLLHALEVPEQGGDTAFANMFAAYEALPPALRERIEGRRAIHMRDRRRNPRAQVRQAFADRADAYYGIDVPDAVHPMVRTHPETGRKSLFVSPRFVVAIADMPDAEAQRLLDEVFAHQRRPEFVYRHKWRLGDVVFWDNRSTIHMACGGIVPPGIRHLHRTSIAGDVPF